MLASIVVVGDVVVHIVGVVVGWAIGLIVWPII